MLGLLPLFLLLLLFYCSDLFQCTPRRCLHRMGDTYKTSFYLQIVEKLHWYVQKGDMVRTINSRFSAPLLCLFCLLCSLFLVDMHNTFPYCVNIAVGYWDSSVALLLWHFRFAKIQDKKHLTMKINSYTY